MIQNFKHVLLNQAARRSAEKAALVPGVDEQVDGAVTAAQVAAIKAVQKQMLDLKVQHFLKLYACLQGYE